MMDDQIERILEAIADLRVEHASTWSEMGARLEAIEKRLDKINGSVGRHDASINSLQLGLVEHAAKCPIAAQVAEVNKRFTAHEEQHKAVKGPMAVAGTLCVSLLFALTLMHGSELLQALKLIK